MSVPIRSKILVVDDEHSVRWAFEKALQKVGYEVSLAETGTKGLKVFSSWHPDLTMLDIRMPEMDGLTVLKHIREEDPNAQVIVMTAYSDMETTITAMKLGAYDFLTKPFNIDDCLALIARGLSARAAEKIQATMVSDPVSKSGGLLGNSPPMQEVYKLIGKVSAEDVTVLITGESGSGKELVAQAIHGNSNRSSKPFWAINCTAVSESLMESELFGYEKGAFTGAGNSKAGVFEMAQGGTLFLDELGDMSLEMQANLLRVLEEREIVRVGGNKRIKVDVRIIAATNKDLRKYIQENRFRDDLFHRIKVIEINLPPLRERVEDIPVLAKAFTAQLAPHRKGPPKTLSDEAVATLCAYPWPGNVRELKNAIDQSYTLSRDQIILPDHLPLEIRQRRVAVSTPTGIPVKPPQMSLGPSEPSVSPAPQNVPAVEGSFIGASVPIPNPSPTESESPEKMMTALVGACLKETDIVGRAHGRVIDAVEKEVLAQALALHKGNQVQTANYLGITRNTLRSKIEKYGL
ncbi:MAG: sigma-54 dependent transcriptional regulator [Candidatus Ozemobacteraceae bacterium]